MDTQTLLTFQVLSKLKNFTLTANHLFVAQSTVTNRITELEKEVGKKLFLREHKNLTLTEEGQIFLSYTNRILELYESALSKIHSNTLFQKYIRIGTTNTIYECHLSSDIQSQIEHNNDIAIKITIGHS